MPEKVLYLARHGATKLISTRLPLDQHRYQGHIDFDLNAEGKEQAEQLRQWFIANRIEIGALVTSDLARAIQTGLRATDYLQLRPRLTVDRALREKCYGFLEGLTKKEVQLRWPGLLENITNKFTHIPPGNYNGLPAQNLQQLAEQALPVLLAQLEASDPEHPTLIVAHTGILRVASYAFGEESQENAGEKTFPLAKPLLLVQSGGKRVLKEVDFKV